jgi:hypothetical protein
MHDQSKAVPPDLEDLRDESAVLIHVLLTHPDTLRISDLSRELGDPEDFSRRDRVERAVGGLVQVGLLFRCEQAVLPTRAALRAYEVLLG